MGVRAFRWLVNVTSLLSVGLVVLGISWGLEARWIPALAAVAAGILLLVPAQYVRIRPQPGAEHVLLLVTKQECSLCDEARILLPSLLEGTPLRLEEARIEDDRFLRRHFRKDVPVLLWQGEVLAKLRFDADALRVRIAGLVQARPS